MRLAETPVEDPDQLAMIADDGSIDDDANPTDLFPVLFREACLTEAEAHDGWVHPSRVTRRLKANPDVNTRRISAMWSVATGANGYLDTTDEHAPCDSAVSRGNGNKSVRLRRWRGWTTPTTEGAPL